MGRQRPDTNRSAEPIGNQVFHCLEAWTRPTIKAALAIPRPNFLTLLRFFECDACAIQWVFGEGHTTNCVFLLDPAELCRVQ